jgi:hypothetical protein
MVMLVRMLAMGVVAMHPQLMASRSLVRWATETYLDLILLR